MGWEGFALVLCVVLLCVVCFEFRLFLSVLYYIIFLFKNKYNFGLVRKKVSSELIF